MLKLRNNNKPFLDLTQGHDSLRSYVVWLILMVTFVSFVLSVVIAYVDPFKFPTFKLIFDILELSIFTVGTGFLIGHLWYNAHPTQMSHHPRIIPHL